MCRSLCLAGVASTLVWVAALAAQETAEFKADVPVRIKNETVVRGFEKSAKLYRFLKAATSPMVKAEEFKRLTYGELSGSTEHLYLAEVISEARKIQGEIKALQIPADESARKEVLAALEAKLEYADGMAMAIRETIISLEKVAGKTSMVTSFGPIERLWITELPKIRREISEIRRILKSKIREIGSRSAEVDPRTGKLSEEGEIAEDESFLVFSGTLASIEERRGAVSAIKVAERKHDWPSILQTLQTERATVRESAGDAAALAGFLWRRSNELTKNDPASAKILSDTALSLAKYIYAQHQLIIALDGKIGELQSLLSPATAATASTTKPSTGLSSSGGIIQRVLSESERADLLKQRDEIMTRRQQYLSEFREKVRESRRVNMETWNRAKVYEETLRKLPSAAEALNALRAQPESDKRAILTKLENDLLASGIKQSEEIRTRLERNRAHFLEVKETERTLVNAYSPSLKNQDRELARVENLLHSDRHAKGVDLTSQETKKTSDSSSNVSGATPVIAEPEDELFEVTNFDPKTGEVFSGETTPTEKRDEVEASPGKGSDESK